MFEELFEGPIARARQRESPLPDERRRFLSHLQTLGYAHSSLRAIACELIVIAARLDLSGSEPFDAARVTAAARRWATYQVRRHHGTDPALSTRIRHRCDVVHDASVRRSRARHDREQSRDRDKVNQWRARHESPEKEAGGGTECT